MGMRKLCSFTSVGVCVSLYSFEILEKSRFIEKPGEMYAICILFKILGALERVAMWVWVRVENMETVGRVVHCSRLKFLVF